MSEALTMGASGVLELRKHEVVLFLCTLLVFLPVRLEAQEGRRNADRILVNGKIWTGDDSHPQVEALAIKGDKILAVGSTKEIRALARTDTVVVDLKGRLVVPGFQDSHVHFPGASVNSVRLDGIETLAFA